MFSTGRGTESVARGFRQKIRNCQHSPAAIEILGRIERSLGNAERWIIASETQLTWANAERRMARILETIGEAEDMLAEAEDEFDLLDGQVSRLEGELGRLLPTTPRPTPEELADRADGELRGANLTFREAPNSAPQLVDLRARHAALSERLSLLRVRITA
ncbi:hypothetical protein [Raineyella sp. W15-4]|uniref:hypothetical protein n=1 Tax=Raineyella sp. W15-4 TaxID=3081651 RepID=UPI002954194D|nr:hypothetical protein [Raineyella sp. W15-4]WOQ17851.1 hypothetical protein R0145_03850 [Raineyella sp. W15-4]